MLPTVLRCITATTVSTPKLRSRHVQFTNMSRRSYLPSSAKLFAFWEKSGACDILVPPMQLRKSSQNFNFGQPTAIGRHTPCTGRLALQIEKGSSREIDT